MQITHITANRREEWNAFVTQEPSFALLQSWEWGEFKEKLGWKVFRVAIEQSGRIVAGAQMLIKPVPLKLASIAYIPRGPVGNWLDDAVTSPLLLELHRVARQHKAVFLKIEPPLVNDPRIREVLQQHRFQASNYSNQPQATIVVDLTLDLDNIFKQIPRETRYSINYAAKKGVTVHVGNREDLPAFHKLMQITARRGQFPPRILAYYEQEWQTFATNDQVALLLAYHEGRLLAARTAFCFGEHAADFHAGSSGEARNLRPNHMLVWEAIKWAKARGCRTYDLWGIPNEVERVICEDKEPVEQDRSAGLWGVYNFKRSFSQNILFYVGAYDHVYSPWLYASVTNKFFNANTLDRVATWVDSFKFA